MNTSCQQCRTGSLHFHTEPTMNEPDEINQTLGNAFKETSALFYRVSKAIARVENAAEFSRVLQAQAAAIRYAQHIAAAAAVAGKLDADELELAECSRRSCISMVGDLCGRKLIQN